MKTLSEKIILEAKIVTLRNKQAEDLLILKEIYYTTLDSLKPLNLIKSATVELITDPKLKSNLIIGTIGLGVNYFSNKLLNQNASNSIERVIEKVLKFGIKFLSKKNNENLSK
jgi:hypothetical protein